MISTIDLRKHIVDTADELNLPLTMKQVDQLTTRVAARVARGDKPQLTLSNQRYAVLVGLASGEEVVDTARRLCLSVDTVRTHRRALYKALGVGNGPHAVAVAMGLGILNPAGGGRA